MATTGALNGTDVFLRVLSAGDFITVGGQLSHTETVNNGLIDLTNKDSLKFRELQSAEGIQNVDITTELVFNSSTSFDVVKAAADSKAVLTFQVIRKTLGDAADDIDQLDLMVVSFAETSPDGDKLTASVSLQSTDVFERALQFEAYQVLGGEQFEVVGNIPLFVRV